MLLSDGILHIDFGGGSFETSYRRMDCITGGEFISEFRRYVVGVFVGKRGEKGGRRRILFSFRFPCFFKKTISRILIVSFPPSRRGG